VVIRQFPAGDRAAAHEARMLLVLDGLGGLAPRLLRAELEARWSECPTVIVSWLDGEADITPSDPPGWATELGRALARVHAMPTERLSGLPSVFDRSGSRGRLHGPAAHRIRSSWRRIMASHEVLTHSDYWSGNVVWRDGTLTGIVDWCGAVRGPRGYDVGWCRLDLYLLFGDRIADAFLAAYEDAVGHTLPDTALWDAWALARSYDTVETWTPNYRPLGRPDLDARELRARHDQWTSSLPDYPASSGAGS
jgi:aminoglycoside phosphotransferase (APT) family kinase protein